LHEIVEMAWIIWGCWCVWSSWLWITWLVREWRMSWKIYSSLDLQLVILIMGHSRYVHRWKLEVVVGMIIVWIEKHM
jgi:hypothetical protein